MHAGGSRSPATPTRSATSYLHSLRRRTQPDREWRPPRALRRPAGRADSLTGCKRRSSGKDPVPTAGGCRHWQHGAPHLVLLRSQRRLVRPFAQRADAATGRRASHSGGHRSRRVDVGHAFAGARRLRPRRARSDQRSSHRPDNGELLGRSRRRLSNCSTSTTPSPALQAGSRPGRTTRAPTRSSRSRFVSTTPPRLAPMRPRS